MMLAGCDRQRISDEMRATDAPQDLGVEAGSRMMAVSWKQHSGGLISGYYVYINEEPRTERRGEDAVSEQIQPFNRIPFAGDTNPDDGIVHFVAEGLDNGAKYYVSVRVVYPDRTLSWPSVEIPVVCGPRGVIELSFRFRSDHDGYSFEKDNYVRADAVDNDLYFFCKDGIDYLASPSRLDGFLRTSNFSTLPFKGELDEVKTRIATLGRLLSGDRIVINKGDWLLLRTPQDNYALVNVLGFDGVGMERTVSLFFTYSTLAGEKSF